MFQENLFLYKIYTSENYIAEAHSSLYINGQGGSPQGPRPLVWPLYIALGLQGCWEEVGLVV